MTKKKEELNLNDPRDKAVKTAVDMIKDKFGDGSIMRLGEASHMNVDVVSSGCLSLDIALGVMGYPKGRVIEIFGPESSGKTTLAQHAIAEVQKAGGVAAFVDAEHALDPSYARRIGVDVDNLLISQPDYGEQALDIVETLVRSGAVDIIVVDSVAALTPKAEIDGEMGDQHMGLQARLMSQALRKLTAAISRTNTIVIFINQIRQKIGVFFGNPETTTGGNALKFYSSVRLEIRRKAQIKQGDTMIGNQVRVKVVKNKVAPPFSECEFDIMYNQGISKQADVLNVGVNLGIINKAGNTYTFGDTKLGIGKEAVKAFLKDNENIMKEIRDKVVEKMKSGEEIDLIKEKDEPVEEAQEENKDAE